MIFYGYFNLPQHLLGNIANCSSERGDGVGSVEIENCEEILMLEMFAGIHSAS